MTTAPKYWAVIPAAGVGERFGANIPKQYATLHNQTVLEHALQAFLSCEKIAGIVIALHVKDQHFKDLHLNHLHKPLWTTVGGKTRAHSVLNALVFLQQQVAADDFVLVHDAARPCLTQKDLDTLINNCTNESIGGILGVPVCDTLKKVQNTEITATVDRKHLWRALTPQMFRHQVLVSALTDAIHNEQVITDEASAIENQGHQPKMVAGDVRNIKITSQEDLHMAELFLQAISNEQ